MWIAWTPMVIGAATLITFLGVVRADRKRRSGDWKRDPASVLAPMPPHTALLLTLLGMALAAGVGAAGARSQVASPVACWLAALTCAGIGHRQGWTVAGSAGLLLAGEGVVLAAMGWYGWQWWGAAIGSLLAAAWMAWLARFWRQQLHERRPWTTAGRLIPAARAWAVSWLAFSVLAGVCALRS